MIAIAGSKGGCGTSTVTLGLAEAFARADTPAVAIDADRQLPNLHVLADCERSPTIADIEDGADVTTVAQRHPQMASVGIVPAPRAGQAFDFDALADEAAPEGVQMLLDCPSGAGPDVVDPLERATGVIVVTTATERSLEAAETTLEMARRLRIPVYGVVCNQCSAPPARVGRWEGVPVLGCVPERPSPLSSEDVAAAFDDLVSALAAQSPTDRASATSVGDALPTGTTELDAELGGGFPPGSVVALVAAPASQAEHLLYRATAVRGTLYLSTDRTRETVRHAIDRASSGGGTPTIRRVTGDDALAAARTLVDKLPDGANVLVDPVDELERRDRADYVQFLEALKSRTVETAGLAILHCLRGGPANRTATLRVADAVVELETVAPDVDADPAHYLRLRKYRPDAGRTATVEVDFTPKSGGPIESPRRTD